MAEMTVIARSRSEFGSGASRRLRRHGEVPGIVYGGSSDNVAVTVSPKDLLRLLRSHSGRNTILNLEIDGAGSDNVILRDWQVDPVNEDFLHADFQRIAMDQKLTVTVPLRFVGTPIGVKAEGGLLDAVVREIEVECFPADIPDEIEFDVSELHMNDSVRIGDLKVSDRVEILEDADQVVVHVVAIREEEPEEEVAEELEEGAPTPEEPEVVAKGKKEEEEEA
jgi:large subunit ribosomal protein L25